MSGKALVLFKVTWAVSPMLLLGADMRLRPARRARKASSSTKGCADARNSEEGEGGDLAKILTHHHTLKYQGARTLPLSATARAKTGPLQESAARSIQEKEKARLTEIIVRRQFRSFRGD